MRAYEFESQDLPSVARAQQAIPQILVRAQRDYDAWDEEDRDTYAGGGICHIIADSVCDVLSDAGIECTPVSCSYEQHVYVAARFAEGIYTIDIPYHVYEQGGGFSWKKLPDVRFEPRDVVFYRVSGDPADWRDYLDEGMRDVVNFVRNIGSERDAPIVMMTNPQNTGARTASGQRMRIEDFPLKTVAVSELKPWEPMIKMRDLPSQRTVASLTQTLQQGGRIPPLLVTPVRGGYRIIDGHHRYAALQRAGIEQAPVRVVDPRLIRYSDEVREALKITLERYGHLGAQTVTESLDQPYRIKWGRSMHGDYDALATLDDGTYLSIMFNNESKNNWMVEFYRNNRQEVTGEGDAQRVFATVLTAIAQFIKKKKPVSLFFSAVKEDDPKGSREKLYDRLVQRYAGSLGYTVHQGRTPMGSMAYKLTRKQQGVAESLDQPHQTQLGPQLFVSRQTTTEDIKPRGAAWTSTAQKTPQGFTSDWVEWCKDNMAQWVTDTGILYDVAPGARILLVRTDRDVIRVARRYGLEIKNSFDLFEKMDWDLLRRDYDAIHHIPQGRSPFMSAWDVESTAWFDRKFLTNPRRVTVDTGKTQSGREMGARAMAEGIDPDTFEELDARIIARAAKRVVPTARARRTPEGYVHVTTEDGLDLYIGAGVADGSISVNIGSGGGVTTSGAHKGAVTEIIRSVYNAAVRKYGRPDTPGELTIDHDAGHGVWQHIADKLGLTYAAVEVKESGVRGGQLSETRDQLWAWIQSKFPSPQWPEYVQRDFLYAQAKGIRDQQELKDFLERNQKDFGQVKWRLEKLPITLNIFTPKTQRMIRQREGGSKNPYQVPKDAERHALQQQMIQQKGVSPEPIIVTKLSNGYDLIEGWHRTIQHLKAYPNGYTGPAWVGYGATYTNESKQGVAEGRISDLDIDLQDQQWEAVVGFVQDGVRRGEDPDRMSLALYQWATDEMFDVDEELERRGFSSVADLADHIRDHGGRYVPPEFDLGAAGSINDIQRLPRRRPDDVSEATSEPDFMRGHCHVMALALLTLHPDWQLRAHIGWDEDAESDSDYRVDHVYVMAPDGTAHDCRGRFASEQELVGPDETGGTETQFIDYDIGRVREDVARGELRPFSRRDLEQARAFARRLAENFADGKIKGKSRPGRVRRAGASCKGSVTDLRARARKYGGERGKMYHWCANMKSGRKK